MYNPITDIFAYWDHIFFESDNLDVCVKIFYEWIKPTYKTCTRITTDHKKLSNQLLAICLCRRKFKIKNQNIFFLHSDTFRSSYDECYTNTNTNQSFYLQGVPYVIPKESKYTAFGEPNKNNVHHEVVHVENFNLFFNSSEIMLASSSIIIPSLVFYTISNKFTKLLKYITENNTGKSNTIKNTLSPQIIIKNSENRNVLRETLILDDIKTKKKPKLELIDDETNKYNCAANFRLAIHYFIFCLCLETKWKSEPNLLNKYIKIITFISNTLQSNTPLHWYTKIQSLYHEQNKKRNYNSSMKNFQTNQITIENLILDFLICGKNPPYFNQQKSNCMKTTNTNKGFTDCKFCNFIQKKLEEKKNQ
jgi:hypothetical protein